MAQLASRTFLKVVHREPVFLLPPERPVVSECSGLWCSEEVTIWYCTKVATYMCVRCTLTECAYVCVDACGIVCIMEVSRAIMHAARSQGSLGSHVICAGSSSMSQQDCLTVGCCWYPFPNEPSCFQRTASLPFYTVTALTPTKLGMQVGRDVRAAPVISVLECVAVHV